MTSARELARTVLEHIGAGRIEEAVSQFAPTVDFRIPHADGIPWIPPVRSRDDMRTFFGLMGEHLTTEEFEIEKVLADDEDVLLIGRMRDTVVVTGRSFTTPFVIRMTVVEGLVTRYHVAEDSHAVARAYFG